MERWCKRDDLLLKLERREQATSLVCTVACTVGEMHASGRTVLMPTQRKATHNIIMFMGTLQDSCPAKSLRLKELGASQLATSL